MNKIPFIPENAPFTPEQRLWLNGFLAGLLSDAGAGESEAAGTRVPALPPKPLVVLYGSQTGTAEGLAKKTSREAEKRGFAPRLVDLAKYETVDLAHEQNVLVITSTYCNPSYRLHIIGGRVSSEDACCADHQSYRQGKGAVGSCRESAFEFSSSARTGEDRFAGRRR